MSENDPVVGPVTSIDPTSRSALAAPPRLSNGKQAAKPKRVRRVFFEQARDERARQAVWERIRDAVASVRTAEDSATVGLVDGEVARLAGKVAACREAQIVALEAEIAALRKEQA